MFFILKFYVLKHYNNMSEVCKNQNWEPEDWFSSRFGSFENLGSVFGLGFGSNILKNRDLGSNT
jgi:hypothetical protein